nr:STAS domain-containing protein [Cellulomonas sp. IC4_254]
MNAPGRQRGAPVDVSVASRTVEGRTVVDVTGEIDVYTAPALREKLTGLVDAGHVDLVVNLTEVRFMDSTGLGLLVGVLKRVRGLDGRLQLVIDSERLLKVFRITALTQVFTIRETVNEALAADREG